MWPKPFRAPGRCGQPQAGLPSAGPLRAPAPVVRQLVCCYVPSFLPSFIDSFTHSPLNSFSAAFLHSYACVLSCMHCGMHLIDCACLPSFFIPGSGFAGPPLQWDGSGFFLSCSMGPPFTTPHPQGGGAAPRGRGPDPGSSSSSSSTWRGAHPRIIRPPVHPHPLTPPSPSRPLAHVLACAPASPCRQVRTTTPPSLATF